MWGRQDDQGRLNLWMAICYNENCLGDYERRREFYDKLTARDGPVLARARIEEGHELSPSEIKADWPGPVTRVDQLPQDHEAVQYLLSRDFDPDKIGRFYNVHYCHASFRWLAANRLIIPIYEDRQMVGWQARYVGELPWHDKSKEDLPPKYYTMPNTPRRAVLYNFGNCCQFRTGVIVEGPSDVWGLGPMATATLGSTMTNLQRRKFITAFRKHAAILLWDPDVQADHKKWPGVEKLIEHLHEEFRGNFTPVWLPQGRDPGSTERQFLRDYIADEARKAGVKVDWRKR
jgi:hypothetical protein